jgi:hypothetical protein
MRQSRFVIEIVQEKYGEWLEMAGDDSPALLCDILASLLAREMDKNDYYIERLKEFERIEKI